MLSTKTSVPITSQRKYSFDLGLSQPISAVINKTDRSYSASDNAHIYSLSTTQRQLWKN